MSKRQAVREMKLNTKLSESKWKILKSKKAVKIGGFLSAAQQTVTSKKNIAFRDESCSLNALPYVFELQTKRLAARQSGRLSTLPDMTQFNE